MKELKELRQILCSSDEIRGDLTELRFGCKITFVFDSEPDIHSETIVYDSGTKNRCKRLIKNYKEQGLCSGVLDITIGNPIQERHIRIYCDKKGYPFAIGSNGKILGNRNEQGSYVEIKLDNSKDLEQQSPETLQAIIDFLKGV